MTYQPVTPFRRAVDAVVLDHMRQADDPLPVHEVNKWDILRALVAARASFDVSDRELQVLQALLSFYPATSLGGDQTDLIVFPSNAALCDRLNGMACSTMRRHLAGLVRAGLILRRDSPNGKRYARRDGTGQQAFGFDLSPLVRRWDEITAAADAARAEQETYRRLREAVSLMRRDLAGLVGYAQDTLPHAPLWDQLGDLAMLAGRALRRKLTLTELHDLEAELTEGVTVARGRIEHQTEDLSTNDVKSEQHQQNSKTDTLESEPCLDSSGSGLADGAFTDPKPAVDRFSDPGEPNIPLVLVLQSCPDIQTYATGGIRNWRDLQRAAETVCPMMGISPSAWSEAQSAMGPYEASVVVAAMLERFDDIRSPGGYLRSLSRKAEEGAFSCGPMIMALMRKEAA